MRTAALFIALVAAALACGGALWILWNTVPRAFEGG